MATTDQGPEQGDGKDDEKGGRYCRRGGCHRCCGRRPWWARLLVLAVIIGAIFAWHVYGHDGYGCHSLSRAFSQQETTPARMREHAERITGRMMDRVEATSTQRAKAATIAQAAADDLQALVQAHRATRASLYSALSADTVDPARIEQLRSEALQRADAVSRRLTQEMVEMADLLSPKQRRVLLSHWQPALGA
ncbi:MAG: hypothetical protein JWM03_220 [Rhodocyclales bacterium]|nr:hypothetical protein [Rhodocyclales bacterium]